MDNNFDHLKKFLDSVKTIGLFSRIFSWWKIKDQIPEASADLQKLISNAGYQQETIARLESANSGFQKDLQLAIKSQEILNQRKSELDVELAAVKRDFQNTLSALAGAKEQNIQLLTEEEFRKQQHDHAVTSLSKIQEKLQGDRQKEIDDRNVAEIEKLKGLKETWINHQEKARRIMKSICHKHTIAYVEKVPFKGDPDNTLNICDEYVVFDAKSPGGDDPGHFPQYLKEQAEKAKKYAQQENVRSDIFFVVPSNTLDYLTDFVYRHGDHNVYVISHDALEPVILALKKIEEYEFAEQLSPDDRENICRVLGRFAHLSKRRIQVDSFFARQFIELAYKCETDLPKDILETVIEFEKSEKLNPPQEKRAKSIPVSELEKDIKKIKQEADSRGIAMEHENMSDRLNEWPLYKKTDT